MSDEVPQVLWQKVESAVMSEGDSVSALEKPRREMDAIMVDGQSPESEVVSSRDSRPFPRLLQLGEEDSHPEGRSVPRKAVTVAPHGAATEESVAPPTPEFLADLAAESRRLESADPATILSWAIERFGGRFAFATAFGPEGMTLIHFLAALRADVRIFNLDTGYQFPETLRLRDQVVERYGIDVELLRPDTTVEEYEALHGGPVYKRDAKQCCHDRKIVVLRKALVGVEAWASAIRRDQSPDRAQAPIVGWDAKFSLVKVSPLANWTRQDVWRLIMDERIPYNPLHDQGYTSIGCWPCTRAVRLGEDERAGRWSGQAKTECGLHSLD